MIVGKGVIAAAFTGRFAAEPGITLFASGVSNSNERSREEFSREERRLRETIAGDPGCIVYFGTCSVDDPEQRDSPYVLHKRSMERLVQATGSYVVLRLPQVVGHTPNPFTLTNYLFDHIAGGRPFTVWRNAWRNIIDVDDVASVGGHMLASPRYRNRIVNVASPAAIPVPELVATFERVLGTRANCEVENRGSRYDIDVTDCLEVARLVGVEFGPGYVEKVIRKYYGTPRRTA